jgi:hypothetical protein
LSHHGRRVKWRRIQTRPGVKRLGSHVIRHSYGQGMARAGASIADIQGVQRHRVDKMALHCSGLRHASSGQPRLVTKSSRAG